MDRTDANGKPDISWNWRNGSPAILCDDRVIHNCSARRRRSISIYPIPPGFKLSVVIPLLTKNAGCRTRPRIQIVEIPKELILVNDFSTDGAGDSQQLERSTTTFVFHQPRNMGSASREGSPLHSDLSSSGTPTGNTIGRIRAHSADLDGRPMSSSVRALSAKAIACCTTGTGRQPVLTLLELVYEPEPHRHGDVQGL